MNRSFGTLLALSSAVSIALFLGGCNKKNGEKMSGGGSNIRGMVSVEAQVVRPQLLRDRIFATGTLLANEEVELRSEISGRITGVFFEEGKRVRKGEPLLSINNRELKARLKGKEVEEKQALDIESRQRNLRDIEAISQEDYDRALNALRMIQAEKEAIESGIEKTEIAAPFDGIIGLRYVSEGGYVSPNVLVATMQDIDPMKVEFSVPEKYSLKLRSGTAILVGVGDSPEQYKGVVYAVESKIDPGTRTIKARAKIPNPGERLIPGSFARVEITIEEINDAILIPSEAVIPQINGEIVYVVRDGKAKSVPIKTGIRTETGIQITGGLAFDDTLIVTGLLQLADGKGVKIRTFKEN